MQKMGLDKSAGLKVQELLTASWLQSHFGRQPRMNAVIEMNNLLAERPVRETTIIEAAEIFGKYRIHPGKHLLEERLELYRQYLRHCLDDRLLTDREVDDLHHLRELLALDAERAEAAHHAVAAETMRGALDDVLGADLDQEKVDFLQRIDKDIRLPEDLARKIIDEKREAFIQGEIGKATADHRISPEEWEQVETLAKLLHITLQVEEPTQAVFDRMKMLWRLENDSLPVMEPDIYLQRGEICHFMSAGDWLESRTVTKRVNYGGLGYRVRIMKGLYCQGGSVGLQRVTSEEIQTIDTGMVYVTNKRVLFNGGYKNMSLPLNRIISLVPYSDGLGVEKDRGRNPIFQIGEDAEIMAIILGRLLDEQA